MTPGDRRPWLPVALLLLQVPGCSSLSGPTSVTGTVGGSLSVQCQYEEKFRDIAKYWCKSPCLGDIVKIEKSDKEVRNGRVSIRNHPANLTFTVTLENLTEGDAGTYRCGIDTSWLPGYLLDLTFRVVVSVTPGELWTPLPQRQHQGCLRLGLITPTPAGEWWGVVQKSRMGMGLVPRTPGICMCVFVHVCARARMCCVCVYVRVCLGVSAGVLLSAHSHKIMNTSGCLRSL
uniref:CMRF35-like molecule n=1 Tax=Callorhinus ursinus TaxID=34884 RepID=A0A3Q7NHE5_CALUR|nr:CMRF35-like molecule [Callorhinus ursinus]